MSVLLPAPFSPIIRVQFTRQDIKADVVQRIDRAKLFADTTYGNDRFRSQLREALVDEQDSIDAPREFHFKWRTESCPVVRRENTEPDGSRLFLRNCF